MQQDPSANTFSKQLLDIADRKDTAHEITKCIKLPTDFAQSLIFKRLTLTAYSPMYVHNP